MSTEPEGYRATTKVLHWRRAEGAHRTEHVGVVLRHTVVRRDRLLAWMV